MKLFSLLFVFLAFYSCQDVKKQDIDVSESIVIPKQYVVKKAQSDITIDGKSSEIDWIKTKYSDLFIDIEGIEKPKFDTKIKLLWDNQYLYVYAELLEPHIWADISKRDAIIYYNNDFEVFIDPSNTGTRYGEIELNALNTVWDLLLTKPYRVGGKAIFDWNLSELKTAVKINGTINDPSDVDEGWTIEMAIPLKALLELRGKPVILPHEGEQWRINFSRVEWDFDLIDGKYQRKMLDEKYLPEYNWVWSPQKVINMHEPEKWGYLQFTHESAGNISFMEDEDLLVKQSAFALFRMTRYGELKYLLEEKAYLKKDFTVNYMEGKLFEAQFIKTSMGFEFMILSPFTDKTYMINEEGNLKAI